MPAVHNAKTVQMISLTDRETLQFSLVTIKRAGRKMKYQAAPNGNGAMTIDDRVMNIPNKDAARHAPGLDPLCQPNAASVIKGKTNAMTK
jgi:hypothetical protein